MNSSFHFYLDHFFNVLIYKTPLNRFFLYSTHNFIWLCIMLNNNSNTYNCSFTNVTPIVIIAP